MAMKIPKAIEVLSEATKGTWPTPNSDLVDAIQLGKEALREVKRLRSYKAFHVVKLLPGETEE